MWPLPRHTIKTYEELSGFIARVMLFEDTAVSPEEHKGSYCGMQKDKTNISEQLGLHKKEGTPGGVAPLTDGNGVVDFEAAEHLVDVSGVEKPVSSHHHLERLWMHATQIDTIAFQTPGPVIRCCAFCT